MRRFDRWRTTRSSPLGRTHTPTDEGLPDAWQCGAVSADQSPDPTAFDRPQSTTSADGTEVAVYDAGGSGPDLLLAHATGFCAGVWAPLVERLDGHRVAALDIRGHGHSGAPEVMDWEGTGEDVLAAVDLLDLDHPVGVGHSMGGASLLMAELRRPGTFRALWLFEPIVFPPDFSPPGGGGPNPLVEGARRRRDTFESSDAAFTNYSAKPPLNELHPDCLAAYVRYGFADRDDGSITLRCRPSFEASTYEAGQSHRTWSHLDQVTCPVSVVRGRMVPGPAMLAPGIAERLPDGRLEVHDDQGHFGPLADLDDTGASIRGVTGVAAGS